MTTDSVIIEVLQTDFPEIDAPLGAGGGQRPSDERRFRTAMSAISRRLRRRYNIMMSVVVCWFVVLIGAALLSQDRYAHVIGIATSGCGTSWSIAVLVKLGREVFAIETLLALAARRNADMSDVVALCRELVRAPIWGGLGRETARKVASSSAAS